MSSSIFSTIPIEALFFCILLVTFSSVFVGFTLGRQFRDRKSDNDAPPIGSVIGALFALLAFMLALTFSSASNRHDTRKQLLLDETNAIGTAFLKTGFLEVGDKQHSQVLLKNYVQLRMTDIDKNTQVNKLIVQSDAIQKKLWDIAMTYPKGNVSAAVTVSYTSALTDVFDIQNARVVHAVTYHVHPTIWATLLIISVLSMAALGFQFAYSGGRRVWLCMLLATTFSLVLLLIEDLDRPEQGTIRINLGPMTTLFKSMTIDGR